jgi:hypothetical protein
VSVAAAVFFWEKSAAAQPIGLHLYIQNTVRTIDSTMLIVSYKIQMKKNTTRKRKLILMIKRKRKPL